MTLAAEHKACDKGSVFDSDFDVLRTIKHPDRCSQTSLQVILLLHQSVGVWDVRALF